MRQGARKKYLVSSQVHLYRMTILLLRSQCDYGGNNVVVDGRPLSSTSLRFGNRKESPRGVEERRKTSFQGKVCMHHNE